MVKEKEIALATPEEKILFYDVETGTLLREVQVNGEKILGFKSY